MAEDNIMKPKRTPFPPTEKQLEKQIVENYKRAWEETRAAIAEIYEKYASGEGLTRTDMVKFNRLNKIEGQLSEILADVYKRNRQYLYQSMEAAFLAGYFEQLYELEMQSEILLGLGGVRVRAYEQMLSSSLTGLTLSERLKKNEREIVLKIRQELAQALVQGETYQQAAKRFKGVLAGDTVKAVRVAWTETHRAQEEAANYCREQAAEKIEFSEVWLSSLDAKTRDSHKKMDGKKKGPDGYFKIGRYKGRFPGDPTLPAKEVVHCRCTVVTRIPGRPIGERRGRAVLDPEAVKNNEKFPADMTYDKWYQSRMADGGNK